MTRKTWLLTLLTVLALGGGGYGACAAMTASSEEELVDLPEIGADPGMPTLPPDAGQVTVDPPEAQPAEIPAGQAGVEHRLPVACGINTCDPGELCCYGTGHCYPAECQDCCDMERNVPVPEPAAPRLPVGPEPPPDPM